MTIRALLLPSTMTIIRALLLPFVLTTRALLKATWGVLDSRSPGMHFVKAEPFQKLQGSETLNPKAFFCSRLRTSPGPKP